MPELKIDLEQDNFVCQYIDTFHTKAGGYSEFRHAAAVTLLGIATDRRIRMELSFGTVIPNIWTLFLGESSIAGKSTVYDEARDILTRADMGTAMANEFSKEAIPQALAAEPHRYIFNPEVSGLLAGIHKTNGHLAGLQDDLSFLYDNPDRYTKQLTKAEYEAYNIFINALCCTTPLRFQENTEPGDLQGGLLTRFLLYCPQKKPLYVPVTIATHNIEEAVHRIAVQLKQIAEMIARFKTIYMFPSQKALDAFNQWMQDDLYSDNATGDTESTLIGRLRTYVFKLSIIYYIGSEAFLKDAEKVYNTCLQGNLTFSRPSKNTEVFQAEMSIPDVYFFEAMKHVRGYFLPTSSTALDEATEYNTQNNLQKILRLLKRAPRQRLTRSQLMQKISGRITAKELNELVDLCEDEGIVMREYDNSTDARGRQKHTEIIVLLENGGSI
ncbi:MAG: hypothetical protein U9N40_05035 [Euryarchaeota archaeon]|nr:hypothetical protein [Euryarchaeota archaeon]